MLNVHGHELAVRTLEAGLASGRLHHAYLLSGPAHVGKTTLAMQLAQAVNCTADDPPCLACEACMRVGAGAHADVSTIKVDPEATEGARTVISIDAVKDLIASAHLKPYEGRTRVYIVQGADRLSPDAANALLKVLEEPPPDVLLLLLTDNPDGAANTNTPDGSSTDNVVVITVVKPVITAAGGTVRKKKAVKKKKEATRREFNWLALGWTFFAAAAGAGLTATGRFMFPNVLTEPPSSFKAGFPTDFAIG